MSALAILASGPLLALVAPLALAAMAWVVSARRWVHALAPLAALPALVVALAPGVRAPLGLRHVLFGASLDDPTSPTRLLLGPTAALWMLAAWSARAELDRQRGRGAFATFFLVSMAGNFGVLLADDVASFYASFAVMTYAGYGLVVHHRTAEARRAGRVYLVLALAGEMALLAGLLLLLGGRETAPLDEVGAMLAASPHRDLAAGLLLAGFGVKAGALPVHVWLPLAHPVAPTAASAVLSGAMIKAGLVGWLRFLPLGVVAMPHHGLVVMVLGIAAALLAAIVGVLQDAPKTVLAYSSVSQMGLMTFGVGVALASPAAAAPATAAVVFLAAVHCIAKGALFLGTRVVKLVPHGRARRAVVVGLLWSAANVVGAPLTAGSAAKIGLKEAVADAPAAAGPFLILLTVAPVGTALLMARFLVLALGAHETRAERPWSIAVWGPWATLSLLSVLALIVPPASEGVATVIRSWPLVAAAVAPMVVAALLVGAALALHRRGRRAPSIPAGDLVVPLEAALRRARAWSSPPRAWRESAATIVGRVGAAWRAALGAVARSERALERFPGTGAALLVVAAVLAVAMAR